MILFWILFCNKAFFNTIWSWLLPFLQPTRSIHPSLIEAYPAPEYYQYSEAGSGQYYQYYDGQYYGHGQYLPPYQHYPEHHGALETSHMQQSMNLGEHAHPYDGHVQFRDETQGTGNVPYAHVRYTTSDNIYTV